MEKKKPNASMKKKIRELLTQIKADTCEFKNKPKATHLQLNFWIAKANFMRWAVWCTTTSAYNPVGQWEGRALQKTKGKKQQMEKKNDGAALLTQSRLHHWQVTHGVIIEFGIYQLTACKTPYIHLAISLWKQAGKKKSQN